MTNERVMNRKKKRYEMLKRIGKSVKMTQKPRINKKNSIKYQKIEMIEKDFRKVSDRGIVPRRYE